MRVPQHPPVIARVEEGVPRTLWSVMIPAYNCAHFLKETIQTVLQQDPGKHIMQIEVVDDCSTDADVAKLVLEIGKGRVDYFRQPVNVGSLRNFETCINRSTGQYIHLLHGDDKVKVGFYAEMASLFEKFPEAGAAFCSHDHVDTNGNVRFTKKKEADEPAILNNWLLELAVEQRVQYVAMVVKRSVYEELGGFYRVIYGEDWEMWARIAKHFPIAYTPKNLAQYREHDLSISTKSFISGSNLNDIQAVIDIINTYLPDSEKKAKKKIAEKKFAYYSLNRRKYLWKNNRDVQPTYAYFLRLFRMHTGAHLLGKAIKLVMFMKIYNIKKRFRKQL